MLLKYLRWSCVKTVLCKREIRVQQTKVEFMFIRIYFLFQDLSDGDEFEMTTETANESETTTDLSPVTLQFAYILEMVYANQLPF